MMRVASLLILLALASCAGGPPEASGPWRQLNPDKWSFNTNALTDPPPGIAR